MHAPSLVIPATPDDIDDTTHLRNLVAGLCGEVDDALDRLHLHVADELANEAGACSTALRQLRGVAQQAVDEGLDQREALSLLYAHLTLQLEQAEHLYLMTDLHVALQQDRPAFQAVREHALVIGEVAAAMFTGYVVHDAKGDLHEVMQVERLASVQLIPALMRAISAGFVEGQATPLEHDRLGDMFDELLLKTMQQIPRIEASDPMRHVRMAQTCAIALWNLARIHQRDELTSEQAEAYVHARRERLADVTEELDFQHDLLGSVPDLAYAYDVGVAFASIHPILAERADAHQIMMPRRANPFAWSDLFRSLPGEA